MSYLQMLFYFLVFYLAVLLIFFIFKRVKFTSRQALLLGIGASAVGIIVANFMTNKYQIFIVAILFAINVVFFWTIYNVLHFKYSEDHEHGYKSGIYFLISPVFSTILAPLAGTVVEMFGYHTLFISSLFLYIIPVFLLLRIPSFEFKFNTFKAIRIMEHRVLITMQGYIFMLSYNIIPIFTLFYINTPGQLGNFFGYLAILSAVTAVINSKISDRLKKRAFFFYFFNTINSISYIPLAMASSLVGWSLFVGISNLTYGLSNPFNFALTLDHREGDIVDTMVAREVYLNLGRVIMIVVALIVFLFTQSLHMALLVSVLISFAYPLYAWKEKVYLKK
ncbi:hypothetical protein IT400_02775 [Candidatus Nomurabacteria bacterium]|nr:hypothetical protein [Candidatus Nomurabacteria bacterium]